MDREMLTSVGINYEEGVKRFSGKAQLYEKFLKKLYEEDTFLILKGQIADKNYAEAFRSAHTLKGMVGNLSVESVYTGVSALVEALRENPSPEQVEALFAEVERIYNETHKAVDNA